MKGGLKISIAAAVFLTLFFWPILRLLRFLIESESTPANAALERCKTELDSMGCPGRYVFGAKPNLITWVAEILLNETGIQ